MAETYPSLIDYLEATGLPYRITSTTGGGHAPGSYHYVGQAIDAAGPVPSVNSPELLAIQHSWIPVASQLAELIGPDPDFCVKYGKLFAYSAGTLEDHQDHVHVASTVDVVHPAPEVHVMIKTAMITHPSWDGYLIVQEDGGVFAYDAPFYGSVPGLGVTLSGTGRIIAANATPTGQGYWLMGADGGVFAFGDAEMLGHP